MSQIYKNQTSGPAAAVLETLSAEGGAATPPTAADNYNFSGSIAGGSAANGAIKFITPGGPGAITNGQMDAVVQVDGTSITINGSNQLQATVSQAFKWVVTASTAFTPSNFTGYILVGASQPTITLPAAPALDFWFAVLDQSGNTFVIAQNNGDSIQIQDDFTTTGLTGSVTSTLKGDSIHLVCWVQGPGASWTSVDTNGQMTTV